MKLRTILFSLLTIGLFTVGCTKDDDSDIPYIKLVESSELSFDKTASSKTISLKANRAWKAEYDASWLSVEPSSGSAYDQPQTITIKVLQNSGFNRSGSVKFNLAYDYKTLTVTQSGEYGSEEDMIIYYNNFDKEAATQTFGTSSNSWPYMDQFEGWKNETGSGIANVKYTYSGMSVRNNSNSNGNYSDYAGSGTNNLLFGGSNKLKVKDIDITDKGVNYALTFGTEVYQTGQTDNTFDPTKFHVYVGEDTTHMVEVTYTFPNGYKNGRWDLATAAFTVPSGTTNICLYFKSDLSSAHRIDDIKLSAALTEGTVLDFSQGVDPDTGSSGGSAGSIAAVIASSDGTAVELTEVLVVAKYARGCLVYDQSNYLLVYTTSGVTAAIGDKVAVTGTKATYAGMAQVTNPTVNTSTSSNTVTYPEPTVINSTNASSFSASEPVYIKYTGVLTVSGNYVNVAIEGVSSPVGSIAYPSEDYSSLNNTTVTVTGFFLGGTNYLSTMAISVEGDGSGGGGGTTSYNYKKVSAVTSGKAYLIVANSAKAAKPIADSGNQYGYLSTADVTVGSDDIITLDTDANEFTFTESTDGYTIQQKNGKYLYQSGTYNSFNVDASPSGGQYWEIEAQSDGTFKITNKSVTKYIQYTTYGTYGSYTATQTNAVLPVLYERTEDSGSGGGDGGTTTPGSATFDCSSGSQSWGTATDATYGAGYSATSSDGVTVGYFKHTGSSNAVAPANDHIRVYKNSVLSIEVSGKTIKKVTLTTTGSSNTSNLTVLTDNNSTATASGTTITWEGSVSRFVGHAVNGQVRIKQIVVEYE